MTSRFYQGNAQVDNLQHRCSHQWLRIALMFSTFSFCFHVFCLQTQHKDVFNGKQYRDLVTTLLTSTNVSAVSRVNRTAFVANVNDITLWLYLEYPFLCNHQHSGNRGELNRVEERTLIIILITSKFKSNNMNLAPHR